MIKNVLVTGVTGNLGSQVLEQLSGKGIQTKAAVRNPGMYSSPDGVEAVHFDFDKPDTFNTALSNSEGLFLVAPPMDPFSDKKLIPVIDQAISSGIKHIVLNTAFGVNMAPDAALYKVEKHLIDSGCRYTIIRPNFFMDNFSTGFLAPMINHSKSIFIAAGEGKTSFIAASDIANVTAEIFSSNNSFENREFNLTGPVAIDHYEVAAILGDVTGKEIKYIPVSLEEMKKGALENGVPEPSADMMCSLYGAVSAGYTAAVTDDVREICGKAPVSFRQFTEQNKDCWK